MVNDWSSALIFICIGVVIGALGLWLLLQAGSRLSQQQRIISTQRPAERRVEQTIAPIRFETRPPSVPGKYYLWMNLTTREKEVARLVAQEKSSTQIAEELVISPYTVANHLRHIFGKLEINSRQQLTQVVKEVAKYGDSDLN